ncbi:hypothetical protein BP5796_09206 [Coleophoma crateriformis]|uniref:BHLH domain-containing protein n=1 Tax=Coleophoma crateriformis TaxID=565419 RepID=A0A3D8R3C6_9HELO|nr:hypothetical protein BP5796_09206 [Coleophoma crateriformis]
MEPGQAVHDYYPMSDPLNSHGASWAHQDWSRPMAWGDSPPHHSPTGVMPIWQYTQAALSRGESSMPYYPHNDAPLTPVPTNPITSPASGNYPDKFENTRFVSGGPNYRMHGNYNTTESPRAGVSIPQYIAEVEGEDEDEEDSDNYTMWDTQDQSPRIPAAAPRPSLSRPGHRRTQSSSDVTSRSAKRAHTVVERNYRERLNDKIADLALYLFDTSSDSRTKPSKSLVMTRAKERLKQLESRNKQLEGEVVKLRQHIAILDHIVASSRGGSAEHQPPQQTQPQHQQQQHPVGLGLQVAS